MRLTILPITTGLDGNQQRNTADLFNYDATLPPGVSVQPDAGACIYESAVGDSANMSHKKGNTLFHVTDAEMAEHFNTVRHRFANPNFYGGGLVGRDTPIINVEGIRRNPTDDMLEAAAAAMDRPVYRQEWNERADLYFEGTTRAICEACPDIRRLVWWNQPNRDLGEAHDTLNAIRRGIPTGHPCIVVPSSSMYTRGAWWPFDAPFHVVDDGMSRNGYDAAIQHLAPSWVNGNLDTNAARDAAISVYMEQGAAIRSRPHSVMGVDQYRLECFEWADNVAEHVNEGPGRRTMALAVTPVQDYKPIKGRPYRRDQVALMVDAAIEAATANSVDELLLMPWWGDVWPDNHKGRQYQAWLDDEFMPVIGAVRLADATPAPAIVVAPTSATGVSAAGGE